MRWAFVLAATATAFRDLLAEWKAAGRTAKDTDEISGLLADREAAVDAMSRNAKAMKESKAGMGSDAKNKLDVNNARIKRDIDDIDEKLDAVYTKHYEAMSGEDLGREVRDLEMRWQDARDDVWASRKADPDLLEVATALIDKKTGKILWHHEIAAPISLPPRK